MTRNDTRSRGHAMKHSILSKKCRPLMKALSAICLSALFVQRPLPFPSPSKRNNAVTIAEAYAPVPELNREVLAGVWRLTGSRSFLPSPEARQIPSPPNSSPPIIRQKFPMKEFTTYPKRKKDKKTKKGNEDVLPVYEERDLMVTLSQDGSFVASDIEMDVELQDDDEEEEGGFYSEGKNVKWGKENASVRDDEKAKGRHKISGLWEFKDGKLCLAIERPPGVDPRKVHDTVLVGKVVAAKGKSLDEHPVLQKREGGNANSDAAGGPSRENPGERTDFRGEAASSRDLGVGAGTSEDQEEGTSVRPSEQRRGSTSNYDIHLSVPEGSVKVGKYMYPRQHPSFFDRPIFKPTRTGSFQLRQVLGTLNARMPRGPVEEVVKFRKEQLAERRFFLTSHPIGYRRKTKSRFSRSLNRYVEVPQPMSEAEKKNNISGIRAMEIELFRNSTFSTIAGLGSATILRGKWDIIGAEKDHLWMQIWRFGFGRSVSGSTFSEGRCLTKEDEKTYWGKIQEINSTTSNEEDSRSNEPDELDSAPKRKLLEIRGTVFFGWGLEPEPTARFTMLEKMQTYDEDYGDEDVESGDDEDDEDAFDFMDGAFQ